MIYRASSASTLDFQLGSGAGYRLRMYGCIIKSSKAYFQVLLGYHWRMTFEVVEFRRMYPCTLLV